MASPRSTMPAFDTHQAVKALRQAGFDDAKAEAVVDQINGAITENLVIKADLAETERNLATRIDACATKEDLAETERKLAAGIDATKVDLAETERKLAAGIRRHQGRSGRDRTEADREDRRLRHQGRSGRDRTETGRGDRRHQGRSGRDRTEAGREDRRLRHQGRPRELRHEGRACPTRASHDGEDGSANRQDAQVHGWRSGPGRRVDQGA